MLLLSLLGVMNGYGSLRGLEDFMQELGWWNEPQVG